MNYEKNNEFKIRTKASSNFEFIIFLNFIRYFVC